MRFNNNLLLASFLGVATAIRRTCRPDTTSGVTGTGYYTVGDTDSWANIAADFCTGEGELQNMNPSGSIVLGQILKVPCKTRKRDCSRIPGDYKGYYKVVKGDELSLIASDFCTDNYNMVLLNPDIDSSSYIVTPGTDLLVPCNWN
ncbi:uncharacterized protein L3040_008000 [Drepanopeziza brunnea f. sp. 'multigermtubi']|uniref:LysM09p n=2 Tax=Drepanopeziza brunnea f. sp. 'multigermtubi' TaxID=698441 RepID=J9XQA3_9HELO|nr:putative Ecp7(P20) [Drepanopeziza brunnea f. sp. 'multigermtubi' MB_m1]AFS30727.1 LysM09p [Drepanopeziza brunnea f. sp. 'multigermtubi']EKD13996.1 putative Ecp7(P20) [Drepanopeziza brunnea f. sp. 'multigermtubi' MB_m1]KAJ5035534.1 hypothetical protein L3040_008000 [Drepanopeziza brunnea f. sp. 'multigermtubi']